MKKLILSGILLSFSTPLMATQEIATSEDGKAIVANIKDIEVSEMLEQTKEFNECRKQNEYGKSNPEGIKAAQDCFQKKLGDIKDPKRLQQLAEALNLQSYGLVKSKNAKEIQEYLNNKMYQALTGVKPDEADKKKLVESLKFNNKKHVDQALFIRLYKTQLSKNALYEISRYCFQDLRLNSNKSINNFGEHWKSFDNYLDEKGSDKIKFKLSEVSDTGEPAFRAPVTNPDNKDEIYQNIFKSINIGEGIKPEDLKTFFLACGNTMMSLCEGYTAKMKLDSTSSKVDEGSSGSLTIGAASCLAKNRIQEYKQAIANAGKIEESFSEMQEKDNSLLLSLANGKPVKIFTPGKDGAETLDNLTNFTSVDMLEGGARNSSESLDECAENMNSGNCSGLLSDKEDFDKVKHNLEMQMTLKREVEMARVKALVQKGKQDLEEYLKENGYFAILERYQKGELTDETVAEEIGKDFEAKKTATLQELNRKMGSRQIKADAKPDEKKTVAKEVVQETKEERARLAQVVMFNNIITSHLELTRKGDKNPVGRNVNAWKKEESALTEAQVDPELFSNLKTTDGDKNPNGINDNEQLGGLEFIDKLLGKKEDEKLR